jgi:hypothetical protein
MWKCGCATTDAFCIIPTHKNNTFTSWLPTEMSVSSACAESGHSLGISLVYRRKVAGSHQEFLGSHLQYLTGVYTGIYRYTHYTEVAEMYRRPVLYTESIPNTANSIPSLYRTLLSLYRTLLSLYRTLQSLYRVYTEHCKVYTELYRILQSLYRAIPNTAKSIPSYTDHC